MNNEKKKLTHNAVKRDPHTNMRSARNNWDFWTSLPEALHQVTITMSDRGIPYSYRHIGNCLKADPAYGRGVADALDIPVSKVPMDE